MERKITQSTGGKLKRIVLPEKIQKKAGELPEVKMNVQFLTLVDRNGNHYDNTEVHSCRVALVPGHLSGKDIVDIFV